MYCPVGAAGTIEIEKGWGNAIKSQLESMGYAVTLQSHSTAVQGIKVLPDGSFEAYGDTRRSAKAMGY